MKNNTIKQSKLAVKPTFKKSKKASKKLSTAQQINKINTYFKVTTREGTKGANRELTSENKIKVHTDTEGQDESTRGSDL